MNYQYIIIAFTFGLIFSKIIDYIINFITLYNETRKKNKSFKEVLNNITNGLSTFKTRVNNNIMIDMKISNHDDVSVVLLLNKEYIIISKDNKVIHTSDLCSKSVISNIYNVVYSTYNNQISDIINVFGQIIYKPDYEKMLSTATDVVKNVKKTSSNNEFDIDDILDKINKVGLQNLTDDEKKFLESYHLKNK